MDDFKFNAAKMIAAQKKKKRPTSPESESNWDSSEAENGAPHISSDEGEDTSIMSNKRKKKTTNGSKANNNNTLPKPVSSNHLLKPSNTLSGERTPVKNSPAVSIRSGTSNSKKGNVTVFVDNRGFDSDEDEVSVASKKSLRKDERPPYDFRNALQDGSQLASDRSSQQKPGKSRKGDTYDPKPKKHGSAEEQDSDWDESEDEERETLKAIRQEMERHSKQGSDTKEEMTSSPEAKDNKNHKTKSKNWIVKPRNRTRNPKPPNSPKSPNMPSPRSQNFAATVSEVELSKMKAEISASGNCDNVYENAGELIDTGTYEKASSAHGGDSFSPDTVLPTLPTSGFNSVRENRFVYRYDHGSTAYYDTRYGRQEIYMTSIADKSERLVRKCSLELFAALRIVADFFIIIFLEFLRFVAYHLISVFLVGLLTTLGDYFIKPVLAAFFNTIFQPFAVFLYNIGVALRTISIPLGDITRSLFSQLAMLFRAFRLVEVYGRTSPESLNHQRSVQDV